MRSSGRHWQESSAGPVGYGGLHHRMIKKVVLHQVYVYPLSGFLVILKNVNPIGWMRGIFRETAAGNSAPCSIDWCDRKKTKKVQNIRHFNGARTRGGIL